MPKPPGGPPPNPNSVNGRRAEHRRHLSALYADIPPKRRAAFMRRAQEVLTKILEEAEPDDTRYDEKGRVARLGTSKRDRAAIVRDALASMKTLGEISRDATEQHIAVTKLLAGILAPAAPTAPTIHVHYAASDSPKPSADGGTQGNSSK